MRYPADELRATAEAVAIDEAFAGGWFRTVVFGDLPKTSTGKKQKYVLRERAAAL